MRLASRFRYLIRRTKEVREDNGIKGVLGGFFRMVLRLNPKEVPVDEVLSFITEVDPRKPVKLNPPDWPLDKKKLVINWVIPDFKAGAGGHLNIFRTASFLERFGHTVRIYIFRPVENPTNEDAKRLINENYVTFNGEVIAGTRNMADCDAVIATSWQTAYPVFNIANTRRKFYFIQDYEPMFFASGPDYIFSENTYKFGYAAITAGPWLTKVMREKYRDEADFYEFAYDPELYKPTGVPRKKQILFYARSFTPRRGFEIGALALKIVHDRHPDYEIAFVGWDENPKVTFPIKNLGNLNQSELGPLYNESALALVISLTNPSLLPPEMMACKLPVVDIRGENNDGFFGQDTMALAEPDPLSIADTICDLIENPEKSEALAERGWQYVQHLSWEKSARKVESIIIKDLEEAGNG